MKHLNQIIEIFDTHYPYTMEDGDPEGVHSIGKFKTEKGHYHVNIELSPNHKISPIEFYNDKSTNSKEAHGISGFEGRHAHKVFGTVKKIMQHHLENSPETTHFLFTSSEPSRTKLYHHLAKSVDPNYKHGTEGNSTFFKVNGRYKAPLKEEYHPSDSALEHTDFEPRKDQQKAEANHAHDLHQKLKNHYSFDHEASHTIKHYTARSNDINGQLWKQSQIKTGYKYPLSQSGGHEKTIEALDKVVKTHKTPHELTVWSKSAHDPRKLADASGRLYHPAFMSTSIQRSVARNLDWNHTKDDKGINQHHIYKITVPEGSHGAYVDHHSAMSSQKEFILPRGSHFQYHKTEEQQFGKDQYNYHHMSLINKVHE